MTTPTANRLSPIALVIGLMHLPPVMAAESVSTSSSYRLNLERADAFRLSGNSGRHDVRVPQHLAERPYAGLIHRAASDASLDPVLVHAVISVESAYNPNARSPKGAIGLMQVLPQTAARYGVPDPAVSPEANLRAGTRYLKDLMHMFDNHLELVLAAYNAGENAVLRHGKRIPPFPETRLYVPAVLSRYHEWREVSAPTPVQIEYLPGTRLALPSAPVAR